MKYLWRNFEKITPLLKKDCPKALFLDFDGTLTPITDSPDKAKLSQKTKQLLQKLSQKPGFYLTIISGRELRDIKNKINLPNIIYGGNHGLEGEIFGKKFIHPTTKNATQLIKEIRTKLEQLSKQYMGVLIEDKKFALGFHYRMADRSKVGEIKSLLGNLLQGFQDNKLISVIEGKKEIDILPNTNWSKGHFANLVIEEISTRTKKRPIIIAIGDDETDENAFQDLKDGITVVVGNKPQSKAKYYLRNPLEVFEFLNRCGATTPHNTYFMKLRQIKKKIDNKDFNSKEFLQFWKGLVRDSSGRWLGYNKNGIKYFEYGKQAKPNIDNSLQLALIQSSINHEETFSTGLYNENLQDFKHWLIQLHRKQSYFGAKGQVLSKRRVSQGEHTQVVTESIPVLAKKYHDPYVKRGTQIVHLPGISRAGCPMDKWNESRLFHYYPDPKYFNQYLVIMKSKLQQFISRLNNGADREVIGIIANYYQYGINMHMFENVNQSLFANQANAMLKILGLKPIEHGIIDFVAMRLQPRNFANYFFDEVSNFQA